jgi:hypothetical protein
MARRHEEHEAINAARQQPLKLRSNQPMVRGGTARTALSPRVALARQVLPAAPAASRRFQYLRRAPANRVSDR